MRPGHRHDSLRRAQARKGNLRRSSEFVSTIRKGLNRGTRSMAQSAKWDRHDGPGWRQRAAAYRELAETLGPASRERMVAIAASYEEKAARAEREQGREVRPDAINRHRPSASSRHKDPRACQKPRGSSSLSKSTGHRGPPLFGN